MPQGGVSLYLVTQSDVYYSLPGCEDWVFISPDLEAARAKFEATTSGKYVRKHLIRIEADKWTELEEA